MKLLGTLFLLFSASTMSLDSLGHESSILLLLDRWGTETGQMIRAAIGVCGIVLLFVPKRRIEVEVRRTPHQLRDPSGNDADPMAELRNKRAA